MNQIYNTTDPTVSLKLKQKVAELGGLVEGRGVDHRGAPRHVLTRGGAASRVGRQLADAEHVRTVDVVRCRVTAVPGKA